MREAFPGTGGVLPLVRVLVTCVGSVCGDLWTFTSDLCPVLLCVFHFNKKWGAGNFTGTNTTQLNKS